MESFVPIYCAILEDSRELWRITSGINPTDVWGFEDESKTLGFLRKKDCEIAIESLKRHGITNTEEMLQTTDEQLARICFENLQW